MATAKLKPVYALVGGDSYLQLMELAELMRQLPSDAQRVDLEGEKAELADVLDELRSFAMFGGAKIVVVRDAEEFLTRFREKLEDYVAKPSDSSTLVLRLSSLPKNQRIYKAIAKVGTVIECAPPRDLARWIMEQGKTAQQVIVMPDAARLLADLVGEDLGRLDNELAKLALSAKGGKITVDDVSGSVAFQREQEMWHMTDELAGGRPADALRRWRQLVQMDSSAEFRAVTWLGMWLEKVRKALGMKKKGLQGFAIAKELRIWPADNIGPFMKTADALGATGAARAIDLLVDIDRQSKSGVGDAAANVERFILAVSGMMRSGSGTGNLPVSSNDHGRVAHAT